MKFSDVFGAITITAHLLGSRRLHKTIESFETEYEDDGETPRLMVYFADETCMRMNASNADVLRDTFGDDMKKSKGADVLIERVGSGRYAWVSMTPIL